MSRVRKELQIGHFQSMIIELLLVEAKRKEWGVFIDFVILAWRWREDTGGWKN